MTKLKRLHMFRSRKGKKVLELNRDDLCPVRRLWKQGGGHYSKTYGVLLNQLHEEQLHLVAAKNQCTSSATCTQSSKMALDSQCRPFGNTGCTICVRLHNQRSPTHLRVPVAQPLFQATVYYTLSKLHAMVDAHH